MTTDRLVPEVPLDAETRAMALIGMQFSMGLLGIMVRHGVLTQNQALEQVDFLLQSLEGLSDGDVARAARQLVEQFGLGMADPAPT